MSLPCYNPAYSDLSKNQQFYVIVYEEIFRKYFGSEMVNQFRYIKNRTPFLDIDFLRSIFKTKLAGIHSDLFERNPMKRYKGTVGRVGIKGRFLDSAANKKVESVYLTLLRHLKTTGVESSQQFRPCENPVLTPGKEKI